MITVRGATLALANGLVLQGQALGVNGIVSGELVFNTAMTGFKEALTDPSYAGQVLVFSYPLVGNYGFGGKAESGSFQASAVVVSEASDFFAHRHSKMTLDEFLRENNAIGIAGVDTRLLVKTIRDGGAVACVLQAGGSLSNEELVSKAKGFDYSSIDFVEKVSTKEKKVFTPVNAEKRLVVVDCGCKQSIVNELLKRRCEVIMVSAYATANEILQLEPDGVLFSNGPGDPKIMKKTVECCRQLTDYLPIFGISLGHQILAHALGGDTQKLKFGHHGANHAVTDVINRKTIITSQNHGFTVSVMPRNTLPWFVNQVDGSNEGLKHQDLPLMSVQFHPEAGPGPWDAAYLFDEFVKKL